MEHKKYSPTSILKIALGIAFGVWLMMCAPTGWIYDLRSGTGTGQGQTPDPSVSVVHTRADVDGSYTQKIPVTASKEGLIECPLLRLRDVFSKCHSDWYDKEDSGMRGESASNL